MPNELKARVSVDAKQAQANLNATAGAVNNVKVSSAAGTGVWAAYTGAMKAATAAVRGFFSALGVIGLVMSGINLAISLFQKLKSTLESPLVKAHEEAEKAAEDLKKAEEEAAKAAEERFAKAKQEAREYIDMLKEAAELEASKRNTRNQVDRAKVEQEAALIDKMVARGEMTSAEGAARKKLSSLSADQQARVEARDAATQRITEAHAEKNTLLGNAAAAKAEYEQRRAESSAADKALADYYQKHSAGRAGVGYLAARQEDATKDELGQKAAEAAQAMEAAKAEWERQQTLANEVIPELGKTVQAAESELEILAAQISAGSDKIEAAEAELEKALKPEETKAETTKSARPAAESVKPAADAWTRIGAYAGASASNAGLDVARKHYQVAQRHLSLAEKTAARLDRIQATLANLETTT